MGNPRSSHCVGARAVLVADGRARASDNLRHSGEKKGRERQASPAPAPLLVSGSGCQPLHGQIPELPVERDIAPDGTDRARPGQPAGDRPPTQAAAKQVLLATVVDAPEVILDVFGAPASQELRRLHPALCRLCKAQAQRLLGKGELLVLEEVPLLYALDRFSCKRARNLSRRAENLSGTMWQRRKLARWYLSEGYENADPQMRHRNRDPSLARVTLRYR